MRDLVIAYLFGSLTNWAALGHVHRFHVARKAFGRCTVDAATGRITEVLVTRGYSGAENKLVHSTLAEALLASGSSDLTALNLGLLDSLRRAVAPHLRQAFFALSRALAHLGVLDEPLDLLSFSVRPLMAKLTIDDVPPEWEEWCRRWRDTSTLQPNTRANYYTRLLRVGRWLAEPSRRRRRLSDGPVQRQPSTWPWLRG
jgi:hypothetical protein